ncbi:hypothetical protein J6T21_03005 [Candidatus Saccharibacteria bacterium]|nr:hypothetical protein [Candidatus Saccharibacteria bacterium]
MPVLVFLLSYTNCNPMDSFDLKAVIRMISSRVIDPPRQLLKLMSKAFLP